MDGFVTFNKESGESSNAALMRLKRVLDVSKAGFAGTLDPFAEGVLPVGIGRATRLLEYVQRQHKTYLAELRFGVRTDTGDLSGEPVEQAPLPPADVDFDDCLGAFIGDISQIPPAYSALKVDGERAYKLARKGDSPTLAARTVTIHSLDLVERSESPDESELLQSISFRVTCSSGTYVRTLGEDIAKALGSEGHLTSLVRESVGGFAITESFTLEEIEKAFNKGEEGFLLPLEEGLGDLQQFQVSPELLHELCQGKKPLITNHRQLKFPDEGIEFAVMDSGGELAAICRREDNLIKPRKVFKPA